MFLIPLGNVCVFHFQIVTGEMNEIKALTGIYHEQQKGALCGQHALNSLLQRSEFSWLSLAEIARWVIEHRRNSL